MKYRKIPFATLGAYGAEFPNSSYLNGMGAMPKSTTVIMQADNTKPAGFPGFFAWLAEAHPNMIPVVQSMVPPGFIRPLATLRTGGAALTDGNATMASNSNKQQVNGLGRITRRKKMWGLGDDTSLNPDVTSAVNAPISDTFDPGILPPQYVAISDTGESTGSPMLTSAGAASLVSSLTQAGQAILTGVNQQNIFNTQLARAQQGLPPLNTTAYGLTAQGIATNLFTDPTTMLWILGGGAALFFLMSRKSS